MSKSPEIFRLPQSLAKSVAYHLNPELVQYYTGNLIGEMLGIAAEIFQYPKFRDAEVIAQLVERYYKVLAPYLDWQERYLTIVYGSQRLAQQIEQKRAWREMQKQCRALAPKLAESQRCFKAVQQELNQEIELFANLLADNANQLFVASMTDYVVDFRNGYQNTLENAVELNKLNQLWGDMICYHLLSCLLVDADYALEKCYDPKGNAANHPAESARHQNL